MSAKPRRVCIGWENVFLLLLVIKHARAYTHTHACTYKHTQLHLIKKLKWRNEGNYHQIVTLLCISHLINLHKHTHTRTCARKPRWITTHLLGIKLDFTGCWFSQGGTAELQRLQINSLICLSGLQSRSNIYLNLLFRSISVYLSLCTEHSVAIYYCLLLFAQFQNARCNFRYVSATSGSGLGLGSVKNGLPACQ